MDGTFDFTEDGTAIPLEAPDWSRRILAEVQAVFSRASEEVAAKPSKPVERIAQDAENEALSRIAESSSETAALLREFIPEALARAGQAPATRHLGKRAKFSVALKAIGVTAGILAGLSTTAWNVMQIYDWVAEKVVSGADTNGLELPPAFTQDDILVVPDRLDGDALQGQLET
ncbi:hypothetical protein [Leucobacter sp. G161]|uniref:hypothetical protein n=1 Tax=Leucobacter sp. G161 TaxID=663704 RepID=UPI00073F05FC|nr:hypothetical protein [Leucobacter sp. G161]